jgi:tRNA dimethylallyltransferase
MLSKLIAIVGPTASGKTGLGIEIAKRVCGEVVSVDSRQVYREMNVGTAKIQEDKKDKDDQEEPIIVDGILHWGIDLIDPDEDYSVADFKRYAEGKIEEILKRKHVPILVGGAGLWISALIDNYNLTQTSANPKLRAQLEARTIGDLLAEYNRLDPDGAEVIDRDNKRRLVRALEVTKITGRPFSQQRRKEEPKYDVLQIGLSVDRTELNVRINQRVDEMIANGLVNEVRVLKEKYGCEIDAMSGIGYRQICEFLNGKTTLAQAIEETKKTTRRYAKRQMTWFKRDRRIQWISDRAKAMNLVLNFL